MSEIYTKSKEEIALELFKEILSTKHSSEGSVRTMLEEIDIHVQRVEMRCVWLLNLFRDCLLAVEGKKSQE